MTRFIPGVPADTITLHIPRHPGIGVPVVGDWRTFTWPQPGAQTVTCARDEVLWCVCCALSQERLQEVLDELDGS